MKKIIAQWTRTVLTVVLTVTLLVGMIPVIPSYAADVTNSVNESLATNVINGISVGAGETVSFEIFNAAYYYLIIESNDVTVTYADVDYPAVDGKVELFLYKNALSEPFDITNHSAEDKTLTLKFRRHDGHKDMPIKLETMEDFTVDQKAAYANSGPDMEGTFYSWTAPSDGVLVLNVKSIEPATLEPLLVIDETNEAVDGYISMKVTQGQKLEIQIAALMGGVAFDAKIHVHGAFTEGDVEPTTEPTTEPTETTPLATEPIETTPPATEPIETTPPATEPIETTPPATESTETTSPATEPTETTPPATEPTETTPPATEPTETTPPATEPEHVCYVDQYTDVDLTKWYHDALDYMVSNGYMNGMSDTSMEPNSNLTRAQWAKLLYEVEGTPSVAGLSHPFDDVPAGKYYTDAVIWAYNNGIVNGVTETKFGPNSQITREQMATMLYRYAGSMQVAGDLSGFTDAAKVSSYALDAMVWATQNGIINGVGNNQLDPKGVATRAQAAKILYEYDK